jgi:hypothetical protein
MITASLTQARLYPLHTCVLIDYRFSSRDPIRQMIVDTKLFECIKVVGSVKDVQYKSFQQDLSTWVFGPSLKLEVVNEMISQVKLNNKGQRCAFIVFRPRGLTQTSDPDSVALEFPCKQPYFNLAIIDSFMKAAGGLLPHSGRPHPTTRAPIALKPYLIQLELPSDGNERKLVFEESQQWTKDLIVTVIRCEPRLYANLLQVQPFYLRFRLDGTPSDFTTNVLREVVDESFLDARNIPQLDSFKEVLQGLLYRWVRRGTEQGRAAADFVLRRDIRVCLERGRSAV